MATVAALSEGAFQHCKPSEPETWKVAEKLVVQISGLRPMNGKYFCKVWDGKRAIAGVLGSQTVKQYQASLDSIDTAVVEVSVPTLTAANGELKLLMNNVEFLSSSGKGSSAETPHPKRVALEPISGEAGNKPVSTPAVTAAKSPTPTPANTTAPLVTPSPTTQQKRIPVYTPTPGRPSPVVQPLAAINPYDTHWRIRAKLAHKYPLRSFTKGGRENRLMSIELLDDQGTAIQATLWRDACDRYADGLEENKVYYVSKFTVKMANKQYNSTRNDYEIHLDARTEIEECEDQAAVSGSVRLEVTPIDQLHLHIGKQAPVDVCGMVTAVGQLGSVKRKVDSSEVPRREITLADHSGKSINVTLWGANAERAGAELEPLAGEALVAISNCRVSEYNGVSLSALARSVVTIEPTEADVPEAGPIRTWWHQQGGRTAALTPAGQGLAGSPGQRSGGQRSEWGTLADLVPTELPSPDDKPSVRQVVVAVAAINPDQTLFYTANPETGRKVVEQDGKWWCEADGKYVEAMERRYVLSFRAMDFRGESYLSAFNREGQLVLQATADELAAQREAGGDGFSRTLKAAQWTQWVATISSRSREYNGDTRMKHTAIALAPLDFAAESRRLLQLIKSY